MCENANPIYRVESIDSDEYDVYDANLTEQQKYIKNAGDLKVLDFEFGIFLDD